MKKQLAILTLLFFACLLTWSQDQWIKTTTPCDKDLILKTPGRWLKVMENDYNKPKITGQERQQIMNRLSTIHQWIYNLYPSLTAVDGVPDYFITDRKFASEIKMESGPNGKLQGFPINGIPVVFYQYLGAFCGYRCGRVPNEIVRGAYNASASTNLTIQINGLAFILTGLGWDDYFAEIMRIDGRPIQMLSPIVGKWKGYDVYNSNGIYNPNEMIVLLFHREGMLPYIPVTRKQYLDRNIECQQKTFDKAIKGLEQPEGLQLLMDKKERDEQIKKQQKMRDEMIKYYRDELDASTKAGLLDSPAIISGGITDPGTNLPVFTTQAKGGYMLVTENPAYFRRDLPKYVPQLIVYTLTNCESCFVDQSLNPYKLIDENFPIEKLQAMIDK